MCLNASVLRFYFTQGLDKILSWESTSSRSEFPWFSVKVICQLAHVAGTSEDSMFDGLFLLSARLIISDVGVLKQVLQQNWAKFRKQSGTDKKFWLCKANCVRFATKFEKERFVVFDLRFSSTYSPYCRVLGREVGPNVIECFCRPIKKERITNLLMVSYNCEPLHFS